MTTRIILPVLVFLLFTNLKAQDTISIKGHGILQVKLLEVGPDEVKYKLYDFQDGPIYTVDKTLLNSIFYENGEKLVFSYSDTIPDASLQIKYDMTLRGQQDAQLHYKGRHSGSVWVGTGTVLFSPILGWIPALMVGLFPPKDKNLGHIDPELRKNEEYYRSYLDKAHKIKKEKIWRSYTNVTMFMLFLAFND